MAAKPILANSGEACLPSPGVPGPQNASGQPAGRLEADGLVRRTPHPTDRRATLAEITNRGHTTVEQAAGALADIRFGLDGMGRDDLSAVTTALTDLREDAGDF